MNTIIKDIVISINSITLIHIMFQYKHTCMKREKTIIVKLLWRDNFKMRTLGDSISVGWQTFNASRLFAHFPFTVRLHLSEELPAHTAPSHRIPTVPCEDTTSLSRCV